MKRLLCLALTHAEGPSLQIHALRGYLAAKVKCNVFRLYINANVLIL